MGEGGGDEEIEGKRMKYRLSYMCFMLLVSSFSSVVYAGECPKQTTQEAFEKADYVIVARMRYSDMPGERVGEPSAAPEFLPKEKVSFDIVQAIVMAVFKGNIQPPKAELIEVYRPIPAPPRERYYLIFARDSKDEKKLVVQTCDIMTPVGGGYLRLLEVYDTAKASQSFKSYDPTDKE